MGAYVAVLLFESSSDAPDYEPLYDESFVLIEADSIDAAAQRALELGNAGDTSFENEAGETIVWKLKHVVDVADAVDAELTDGATLYSRHFRDYAAYRRFEPLLSSGC